MVYPYVFGADPTEPSGRPPHLRKVVTIIDRMEMDAPQWLRAFAAKLGVDPPSEAEIETLLSLAGVAAHTSERTAAPISCWLTARAGITPERALELARELSQSPS